MAEREEPKSKVGNLPRKMQIICKFWMMGNCIKDEKCEYLHNNSDFPSFKNQTNTQLPPECPMFCTGFCKNGPLCKFKHTKFSEDDNPYKEILENNKRDNIENSEILPMWFLEYFFEKPIGLILEEFENDNAEEIESMKADLNLDKNVNIFDYKKLSSKYQQVVSYSSNACYNGLNSNQQLQLNSNESPLLLNNKKIERVGSAQNLLSNLSSNNAENFNNNKTINIEQKDFVSLKDENEISSNATKRFKLNSESLIELPSEKDENIKDKSKNSENSSIKTSDSNSIRNTPANSNVNVFENFENEKNELSNSGIIDKTPNNRCDIIEIIEKEEKEDGQKDNKENEELKIENLINFINEENIISENNQNSIEIEEPAKQAVTESDQLLKKMLSKYSFINFNFRNTNFVPNYNYSNVNNYKNFINSTHFQDGYVLKLEDKESKIQQKNIINSNNNNKNAKGLAKGFNSKNSQNKPATISEQKMEEINKSVTLSNLGKSSFDRAEVMNYLLTKNYPNDIYAMKKISIIENLNLNMRYFFLRYKNFDLIRFSMETDLLIIPEEHSQKYLEAQKASDDVILIYFDDITKDFYGFSKLKFQLENHEVEEYLQDNYNEVLDIFQSQFPQINNSNNNNNKKKFSFLQIEWLWKTKLSYDKVEILKNAVKNYELFVDSEDGQEIASELGFYVCRLMIKRLTKDEVQEYLNTKKQLENEKLQTPFKNKENALISQIGSEKAEGINNNAVMNSNASVNSFIKNDAKNSKVSLETVNNFTSENINYFTNLYGFNLNNLNSNMNKGNLAAMSHMNKMFFNRFMSGGYAMQGNCEISNNNIANAQFQRNFQNFYAANNLFNNQEALKHKQTANNNSFNEDQKSFNPKSVPRINSNSNKYINKDFNIENSKSINVDNNSVSAFNSINIEKMHINSTSNNLLQKFSQVSNNNINNKNNKINIPEEIKNNFENIIFEKINNNYHSIPNLNNIKNNNSNIVNSNTKNNIIVTNISNLQVNISQNSYNNIESENRSHKEKAKKQAAKEKDKKHKRSSASRSRSRTKNKSFNERKKDKKENKEKKKKHKKRSSKDRSESFEEAIFSSRSSSVHNEKEFIKSKFNANENPQFKKDSQSSENVNEFLDFKKTKQLESKEETNKSFDLFDKDDELNIDKLLQESKRVQNENESYDSDVTVKNENTDVIEKKTTLPLSKQPREEVEEKATSVNSNQELNLLNHKRNRSISKEKKLFANNNTYCHNNNNKSYNNNNNFNDNHYSNNNTFYKNNSYFPKQTPSFSNSNFNYKLKEEDNNSRFNQISSKSNSTQNNTNNKSKFENNINISSNSNNNNNSNPSQQFESKLKSNKLFSNAIAKVASSFLKEKKVSPDSIRRK